LKPAPSAIITITFLMGPAVEAIFISNDFIVIPAGNPMPAVRGVPFGQARHAYGPSLECAETDDKRMTNKSKQAG
jgi:hypothetical protein